MPKDGINIKVTWDQKGFEALTRKTLKDLEHKARRDAQRDAEHAIASARCPDHPETRFTTRPTSDGFEIVGCCDKGLHIAAKTAGLQES